METAIIALVISLQLAAVASAAPEGWQASAPRDEVRPEFAYLPSGGPDGQGSLVIRQDAREALQGFWTRSFPVVGGRCYAFRVLRKVTGIPYPRSHVLATVAWRNAQGGSVLRDEPSTMSFQTGRKPAAEPEYPPDGPADSRGWTEIAGVYAVPAAATEAVVELHLRWAPGGTVEWGMPSLTETAAAKPRKVRIAVVHFQPRGGSNNAEQCRLYEPLLEEAARQRADLVVLGETLTYAYRKPGIKIADAAEPVPAPRPSILSGRPSGTTSTSWPDWWNARGRWCTTRRPWLVRKGWSASTAR